ncbi:MAG: PatB family C-S lyase [Bacteroidales bacterium]|nr:PatB family C-S lyase [Bacteroidales bacterium]
MMTHYDFDAPISREGSGDLKHEVLQARYGRSDLLPLWVADMDWETPSFITAALRQRLEHSLYGYTVEPADYWPSVIDWLATQHQWQVQREWLTYIPGIVRGIGLAINVFVAPDEKVIIQPPVYHPFRLVPRGNEREVVENPLLLREDGTYDMDFEQLEAVADDKCRLLILCNPHNPGGRVWPAETLRRLATFCAQRNIIVVSDEIHADMAIFGHKHTPFASVSEEAAQCSITFGAPSKTFNMAGIVSSWAIVPNDALRREFYHWLTVNELNEPSLFVPIATIAAYRQGEAWRQQMLRYVEGNIDYVIDFCAQHLPKIRVQRPQASFLLWLDCRALGLDAQGLDQLFVQEARLALNNGAMFGTGGEGFMRLNVGTQRANLKQALEQLSAAYAARWS